MPSQRARTTCFLGTAARNATKSVLSVCYNEKKKMSLPFIVSSKARRYPDFIRKNSPNPNEFAQFAFNVLMRPDDHATKSRSSLGVNFHTVSRSSSLTLETTAAESPI